MAAGTVTTTEERLGSVQKITFAWTAGTAGEAGTASGQTTYPYTGVLLRVVTVPGTGGTQPTDDYDLTITDEASVDIAAGLLANRDDTNAEWVTSGMGAVVGDKITINVTNAGSGKTGSCVAYVGITPETASPTEDIENALYGTTGIAAFPAAAAAANGVSLAEVVRYIQETQIGSMAAGTLATQLANLGAAVATKAITYDGSVSYVAFTVTGLVAVKVVGYVTTALSNHADTTSVGTATSAAGLIAATAGTAMQTVGQAWVDNAPSKFETFPATWALIGNGEDIAVVGTANLAAGVVSLYCWCIPISAGASVVAA